MTKIAKFIRGDSRAIVVTVRDADGNVVNLTGGKVMFTVNASKNPSDDTGALISKTVTSHTNPTQGISTINLAASDTSSLTPGTYYYDVQFVDGSGAVTSMQADTFELIADITRRTS